MTSFETIWRNKFGKTPPLGYRLREDFPDKWIRFHSLPNSKRYADSDEERSIILDRANTLANEIFDDGTPFWLASSRADEDLEIVDYTSIQFTKNSRLLPKVSGWVDQTESSDGSIPWSTYSKLMPWESSKFDDVFLKIADEEDFAVIFATSDMSAILAPYDGGFDLILPDLESVATLSRKHSDWLSPRTDKM